MLEILSKAVGPHRAVSVYAFLQTRGLAVAAVIGFVLIAGGLLYFSPDEHHEHEAFLTVPVLSATPINGDLRQGVIASVRLPDGSATSITTTEGVLATTVGETACIEKRVYVETGEPRYRFKLPDTCATN